VLTKTESDAGFKGEGRLFEAEAWLKAGKPARYEHKNPRCTPLGIAISNNFHSLAEVLLKNGIEPSPKHFWMAVSKGRVGMIELMLQNGADVHWLDFRQVVYWPNPDVLRLFIERGADTQTGYPIAEALKRNPRAFLGIYKTYVDRHPDWKFQADMALRHFCEEGGMRGVCLMLWAKANPRAVVPLKCGDDPEIWTSGLWQACISGYVEIVKKIGPNHSEDDLDELLGIAGYSNSAELISYLIERGANPNALAKNGDRVLRAALWSLECRLDVDRHDPYCGRYTNALAALKKLVELGARLDSSSKDEIRSIRRCFLKLRTGDLLELTQLLLKHNFAERHVFLTVLKALRVRPQLDPYLPRLYKLFPEIKSK
jgi:hypothetical protein